MLDNCKDRKTFAKEIDTSVSAISKWVTGKAFPCPEHIKAIWSLTKDEIGPMYWYTELPTDVRLKNESLMLLRSERSRNRSHIQN